MTCWPGVTDFVTAAPVAFFSTALMNWRATGSETSASSSATRTSRMAVRTSSSDQRALLGEPVEDAAEAFGEVFEHGRAAPFVVSVAP
jgi:hypothetical protein